MNEEPELSPLAAEMVAGMAAFADAIEANEAIEERFPTHVVRRELRPRDYSGQDVLAVRKSFGATPALFAQFLGVSRKVLGEWEAGSRPVPRTARRYLDDLTANPGLWQARVAIRQVGSESERISP